MNRPFCESALLIVIVLCSATLSVSVDAFAKGDADKVDPCSSAVVLSEMRSYYPAPISVSPDGRQLLERARPKSAHDSTLLVLDAKTQEVIRTLEWTEAISHSLWRPDGRAVSFFSQETSTNLRKLILWDIKQGTTQVIPTPPTFNQPLVRWSPDGTKLAFSQQTEGVVIVSASGSGHPTNYAGHFSMFDWSADSRQLALVPEGELHQIIIIDASSPRPDRQITTNIPGKVLDVAWHPRHNMLILLEHKEGSRYFIDYDYTKETERILFSTNADLRSPAWLPTGQGYIFQWYRHGVGELFIGTDKTGDIPRRLPTDGTSIFLGILPGGKSIAVTHRGERSVQILRVSLQKSAPEVLASADLSTLGAVKPKQTHVTSFDGTRIPILVWRSPNSSPLSRAAIVRVHADLHSAETPLWQEDIQMYLKHGVDFIAVNYRGSPGYGTNFEKAGDGEKRSWDVIAACEYAHSVLSIPYDRIALFGHSNGATIALGAALIRPLHVGVLVLVSLPGLPRDWPAYGGADRKRPLVVLALHGEKDHILPSALARTLIEKALGSDVLIPVSQHWQIIPNEDHVLHLDSSWALVHSTVLRQLNPHSCGQ